MAEEPLSRDAIRELTAGWWLLLLTGALGVVAGVIVLLKPSSSLATLAVVSGIFIIVDSLLEIAASFDVANPQRGASAVLGVLGVIAGVLLVRHPIGGVTAIALLIGIWLIAVGAVRLVAAFAGEHAVRNALVAIVEVIAGVVIVSSPHLGFATLALLVGISFIAKGCAMVVLGIALRSARAGVSSSTAGSTA